MSYSEKEARILINFHRQHNRCQPNHFLNYIDQLRDRLPDFSGELDELTDHYDDPDFQGSEWLPSAKERALLIIQEWVETLEEIQDEINK